jgi:hypothetical protein
MCWGKMVGGFWVILVHLHAFELSHSMLCDDYLLIIAIFVVLR